MKMTGFFATYIHGEHKPILILLMTGDAKNIVKVRFHTEYKPLSKDWWSDNQGDIMPGQTRNGKLFDKYVVLRGKKENP